MPEPQTPSSNLALLGYGNMGRLLEQLAPEFGFAVALKLDEFNNVDGAGITAENFRDIGVAVDFSIPSVVGDNAEKISQLGVNPGRGHYRMARGAAARTRYSRAWQNRLSLRR